MFLKKSKLEQYFDCVHPGLWAEPEGLRKYFLILVLGDKRSALSERSTVFSVVQQFILRSTNAPFSRKTSVCMRSDVGENFTLTVKNGIQELM